MKDRLKLFSCRRLCAVFHPAGNDVVRKRIELGVLWLLRRCGAPGQVKSNLGRREGALAEEHIASTPTAGCGGGGRAFIPENGSGGSVFFRPRVRRHGVRGEGTAGEVSRRQ